MTSQDTNQPSKVVWEAEAEHSELMTRLRDALREVVDPEIGLNIIELGLVRNVRVREGQVELNMILTTPFCPYGPAMLESTRRKAESAVHMPVILEMGMEMWDFSMMEEGVGGADWGMY